MARIMLIEADRVVAGNLKAYFKHAGHELDWHVDPQAAMNAIEKQPPDLLILDLILADRSGIEFLYEFRSYPDWQKLPVVAYSGVSQADLGEAAAAGLQQLDVVAYHYKPAASLAELGQSVAHALQPI